jgi:hypothetical protein
MIVKTSRPRETKLNSCRQVVYLRPLFSIITTAVSGSDGSVM